MIQTAPTPHRPDQPALDENYDVIVVGAGPAGAATAALVAEAGHKTLLIDRAEVPRFHVGESLIPETYHSLKRLGMLDWLNASAFPKKYSVQFVTDTGKESAPFYFDQYKDCESTTTWQVERGVFDQQLVTVARERGTVVRTDAHLLETLFDGDQVTGVKVKLGTEGTTRDISCKVLVDASGQTAFLANRLGLKENDPCLRHGTIWTYWKDAARGEGRDSGATIILQTEGKRSWFWFIPISDDVVSIGCTGRMEYMFGKERGSMEQTYMEEVARCPGIQRRIENAERVQDFFTTKDFSYKVKQQAGPGWVMVGDAGGFIDPVYSTGVFLALKSAEFAADAIDDAIRSNELSTAKLGQWVDEYRDGCKLFRKLVYAFYTPGLSFGSFLKEYPQHTNDLVDILIGDVFKSGLNEMFDSLAEFGYPMEVAEEASTA